MSEEFYVSSQFSAEPLRRSAETAMIYLMINVRVLRSFQQLTFQQFTDIVILCLKHVVICLFERKF